MLSWLCEDSLRRAQYSQMHLRRLWARAPSLGFWPAMVRWETEIQKGIWRSRAFSELRDCLGALGELGDRSDHRQRFRDARPRPAKQGQGNRNARLKSYILCS